MYIIRAIAVDDLIVGLAVTELYCAEMREQIELLFQVKGRLKVGISVLAETESNAESTI